MQIKTTEQIIRCEFDETEDMTDEEAEKYMEDTGHKIQWIKMEDVILELEKHSGCYANGRCKLGHF